MTALLENLSWGKRVCLQAKENLKLTDCALKMHKEREWNTLNIDAKIYIAFPVHRMLIQRVFLYIPFLFPMEGCHLIPVSFYSTLPTQPHWVGSPSPLLLSSYYAIPTLNSPRSGKGGRKGHSSRYCIVPCWGMAFFLGLSCSPQNPSLHPQYQFPVSHSSMTVPDNVKETRNGELADG